MSIVTLVAISVAGVSCLQLEQPVLIENLSGDEIVFGANAYIEAETKASSGTTETTSLTSFYVSAVTGSAGSESSAFNSTQFSQVQGSSPATYKGSKMWPSSDQSYKFYASNRPLTFNAAGTTVSATNTTDVVCAYLTNGTYKTKNTLTFEHIFARFGRVDVAAESGYTISNISIRITPKTGGTYNLRTGAGKTDGTGWSSVTTGSATVVANATGANANDIYLVPGTYEVKATWTATQGGTSITYTDKVVSVPIVGGKTNVVSIVLGGEILLGVDLVEYCDYDYRDNLNYLTFYCDEAGTITWKCADASYIKNIMYQKNFSGSWTAVVPTTTGASFSVNAGDILWIRGTNSNGCATSGSKYNYFTFSNKVHVYGNVNSLLSPFGEEVTSVGDYCFYRLFSGCGSNLYTYAEKKIILPATTLASNCYCNMFEGCTSLTIAPELPATTLANYCYGSMFYGCTSLKFAPELPATTLASGCYSNMFAGCTSLKLAPELPATTLASNCYGSMFYGCTSLTTAPELPATTLAIGCYSNMFAGCTSLKLAPELPATTLASNCYGSMFYGCTSLTTAPELPATTLTIGCYGRMFYGCTKLNYIKALFTTTPSSSYTSDWVYNVAASGTFIKNPTATWNTLGSNAIPSSWTIIDPKESTLYLSFYCDEAGTIGWKCYGAISRTIQYSKDYGITWTSITSTTEGVTISVEAGDLIWFKGSNSYYCSSSYYNYFTMSNKVHVYGNVNSLKSGSTSTYERCFAYLFKGCSNLYTYSDKRIILPSTSVEPYCYYFMFSGCTNLTDAPVLPATTLYGNYCYAYMFKDCSSLKVAPDLPATSLSIGCYTHMFEGCSSLIYALDLPATTITNLCYNYMFHDCSSLLKAPKLSATTLAEQCYSYMFEGCTSLTTAPELPATTLVSQCYYSMFKGCVNLKEAPELPATTLVSYCYANMFFGCSSLNYIKAMFTTTPSNYYTQNWVLGVAATGTFAKNPAASWNVTGDNGVPTGWTVHDGMGREE